MIKTIKHCSYFMNISKLDELKKVDQYVLNLKNQISEFIFNHLDEYIENDVYKFSAHYKQFINVNCPLSNWEVQTLFQDICTFYDVYVRIRFKNFKFQIQKDIHYSYYKRKTKDYVKGDLKNKEILFRIPKGNIHKIVKYLIYLKGFNSIPEKIQNILNVYDSSIQKRIFNLSRLVRERLLKGLHKIEFKTGSYKKFGYLTSSKKEQVFQIDNTNMKYKYWYCYRTRKQDHWLPLQINKKYHNHNIFSDKAHYVVVRENKLHIFLPDEFEEPIFINSNRMIVGIDLNIKHNFATLSNGKIFDYDRTYLKNLTEQLKACDQIKLNNSYSERKVVAAQNRVSKSLKANEWYFKKLISEILDYCTQNNITDLVLEDLYLSKATFIKNDEFEGIKYSRLSKILRLSNIKNWMLIQAEKRGIRIHTTPSLYTSQQCPCCEHIDRDNRKNQEVFCCTNCGYTNNADLNASFNILRRYSSDVLKNSKLLHTFDQFKRMTANSCYRKKLQVQELLESIFA